MKLPTLFRSDSSVSSSNTSKSSLRTPLDEDVGLIHEDLESPVTSEIVFNKIWRIERYNREVTRRETLDSPKFRCSINGVTTHWNMSIRFWRGPTGKKMANPIVLCLNLTGCETEEIGQARVRYQFLVWDPTTRHWDCCSKCSVVLNLENSNELHSIGYENVNITDRYVDERKGVRVMAKIQLIQSDEEQHSLAQDLARILSSDGDKFSDTLIETTGDGTPKDFVANSFLIKCRSPMLAKRLQDHEDLSKRNLRYKLNLKELNYDLARELFRYIYSDKIENVDAWVNKLLPLSVRFRLPGLTTLCERVLLRNLTPENIGNTLLLADQCDCENLKKAALRYCEENESIRQSVQIGNTLAWRVMEMMNPDLFLEASSKNSESSTSNLDSPTSMGSSVSDI